MSIDAQQRSQHQARNVFDVDYFGDGMSNHAPRKLTAQEWEAELREQDRAAHAHKRRRVRAEEITESNEKEAPSVSTKFGKFSGATDQSYVDGGSDEIVLKQAGKEKKVKLPWSRPDSENDNA